MLSGRFELVPLPPIGIGTPHCESLSSYVQRQAQAHGTFPGQLVYRLLAWTARQDLGAAGQWAPRPGRFRIGANNNSFGHADVWLQAVPRLAARFDVIHLTTRSWDGLFPTRGFQHGTLHWCPTCLSADKIPYHRLAWMVQPVRVCREHGVWLQNVCARCGRMLPVLHDRSLILGCPWCGSDLREIAGDRRAVVDHESFAFWAADEIGAIVQQSAECWHEPRWSPAEDLRTLCRLRGLVGAGALGRFLGTSKITAWYWLRGRARPSLPSTLGIFHRFERSLAGHLVGRCDARPTAPGPFTTQRELYLRPERKPRTIDWEAVCRRLREVLAAPLREAPTLISVSESLGIARRTLREHEPMLCRGISERYRERRRLEIAERAAKLEVEMREAVREMSAHGFVITPQNVERFLNQPGLFNRRYARSVFAAVLKRRANGQ